MGDEPLDPGVDETEALYGAGNLFALRVGTEVVVLADGRLADPRCGAQAVQRVELRLRACSRIPPHESTQPCHESWHMTVRCCPTWARSSTSPMTSGTSSPTCSILTGGAGRRPSIRGGGWSRRCC